MKSAIHTRRLIILVACLLAAEALSAIHLARAGTWPERVVRVLTPSAPGSSIDVAARVFAERLAERWGRPIVIDNRPGADGIIAVQSFLQAADDHTLLFAFPGVVTVVPLLHERVPYDPVRDLVPISSVAHDFLAVAVTSTLPVASLDELVGLAKARPGRLNWTAAPGAPYLTFLEFQKRAALDMVHVPYRSSVLALPDLTAGQIQVVIAPLTAALPLAHDGKIKLLVVTTLERAAVAPGLPTASETGYPELTVEAPLGLFGPKNMPPELRERIAADVRALVGDSTIVRRLSDLGMLARASTPAEYAAALADQRARWTALARAHGLGPQP